MNAEILIAVIIYEIVTIMGVGLFLSVRSKRVTAKDSFALAGRGLNTTHVAITLAFTMLGAAHIWGTTENAYGIGGMAVWFGIACAVMLVVITQCTGPWIRKIGTPTVPDMLGKLYGGKMRLLIACVMAPLVFGILCLETQAIAVTFVALTGWDFVAGAIVGGIFGTLYVLLAGMKEVAWLNIINVIVIYASMIIALIALFYYLPQGWEGVEADLVDSGNGWMTSIFGNGDIIVGFAIPTILCCTLFQGISQMGLQTAIAAKDAKTVKKSIWLATPINGMFCVIPALIGMAAFVMDTKGLLTPDGSVIGALFASPMLIVQLLPPWIVTLLLAGFLGAVLSTFAMTSLCPATIFAHDLYGGLFKPNATEKEKTLVMRIVIVIVGAIAVMMCNFQPQIVASINWIFTWAFPMFVMAVIGLFWKRSVPAAFITMFAAWVGNMVWTTFGLQAYLGAETVHGAYIAIIISLLVGIVLTAILPGKKGLFREMREEKDPAAKPSESLG